MLNLNWKKNSLNNFICHLSWLEKLSPYSYTSPYIHLWIFETLWVIIFWVWVFDAPHPTPTWPTPPPPHPTPSWPTPPLHDPPHPWYIFGHKGAFFHGLLHYVSLSVDNKRLRHCFPSEKMKQIHVVIFEIKQSLLHRMATEIRIVFSLLNLAGCLKLISWLWSWTLTSSVTGGDTTTLQSIALYAFSLLRHKLLHRLKFKQSAKAVE